MRKPVTLLTFIMVTVGCAAFGDSIDETTMQRLASRLTKVAAALDSHVIDKGVTGFADDGALLRAATAHDPGLLDGFEAYHLRVIVAERDSAILVCTADRLRALLEDVGCTAKMDFHRWPRSEPCEFSSDPKQVCQR
jgi:hypothetical protein